MAKMSHQFQWEVAACREGWKDKAFKCQDVAE